MFCALYYYIILQNVGKIFKTILVVYLLHNVYFLTQPIFQPEENYRKFSFMFKTRKNVRGVKK